MERRRDPAERPVLDQGLADGDLGDVVDRDGRVRDQLLEHQAPDRDERQPGRREGDERVADGGQQHRRDRDRADPPAPGGSRRDDGPDEGRDAADPGDDAERSRAKLQFLEDEQEPRRAEDPPQGSQRHLGARERPEHGIVADQPQAVADLGEDRLARSSGRGGGGSSPRMDVSNRADTR